MDDALGGASALAEIADTSLASPNNSTYKTLLVAQSPLQAGMGFATAILGSSVQTFSTRTIPVTSGVSFVASSASAYVYPPSIYFDDADYLVAGKTQKLRVRAQVHNNATAWSSVTATFGLYPFTVAGTSNTIALTLGTVVPGSTVAIANPGASQTSQNNSGDFTIPSDGPFLLGALVSADLTTNAFSILAAQLQTRNV